MVVIATSFNIVFNQKLAGKIYSVKGLAHQFSMFLVGNF
jgi:hypothetical protein